MNDFPPSHAAPLPSADVNVASTEVTPARGSEGWGEAGSPLRRRVLVVDDFFETATALREQLENWGYEARANRSAEDALAQIEEFRPEIIISDLAMPGLSGIQFLERLDVRGRGLVFIVLTGQGSIESAVEAMQKGAFSYLEKPIDQWRFQVLLREAEERLEKDRVILTLQRRLQAEGKFGEQLLGKSPRMFELYTLTAQVAPSSASVLITGESGTGKELVAKTIHELSPRRTKPFIPINCAAIPETLLESELFGHEKGSFTGAVAMREGCFELAQGGTVFLDEIGDMPVGLQAKLLRALEERAFRRVGGSIEIRVDVRVIAATNRDVESARRDGSLRDDLYYRLNVFHLDLPPLRDRQGDILLLAQHFVREFAAREKKPVNGLDDETQKYLMLHQWPGNVRELRNVIERAVIVARGDTITATNLPPLLRGRPTRTEPVWTPGMTVDEVERLLILATLERTVNNKTRAAKLLGVSLKTLHNKLRRYRDEGLLAGLSTAHENGARDGSAGSDGSKGPGDPGAKGDRP